MVDVKIKSLALEVKITVDRLIQQLADAGINKTELDCITQQEKETLLLYLNKNRKCAFNHLTLQRKIRSTLNIASVNGKNKKVQIEIRKKHTYLPVGEEINSNVLPNKQNISKFLDSSKNNAEMSETIAVTNNVNHATDIIYDFSKKENKIVDKNSKISLIQENYTQNIEEVSSISTCDKHIISTNPKYTSNSDNVNLSSNTFNLSTKSKKECERKTMKNRRSKVRLRSRIRENDNKLLQSKKLSNYLFEWKDEYEETSSFSHVSKIKNKINSKLTQVFNKPTKIINRSIVIGETISISDLANKMAIKSSNLMEIMSKLGIVATINQMLNQDVAQLIAEEMGHNVILYRENELEESLINDRNILDKVATFESRPPVVTIMGHVDHGKTSLLDYIRSTRIVDSELGGITQHIGAYHVKTTRGVVTFIDTPGHAAFASMRERGVKITDIVVLVVAADDGVMLQTIEAIKHSKIAKVPIVVAINKIDKCEANPSRVRNELAQHGLLSEEWGGDSQFVHVSAKLGTGIDDLLEAILLQAEILNLQSISNIMASGIVIESALDRRKGPVATVLVREGVLKQGDIVLCGCEYGRIRCMQNEMGKSMISAGPSIPIKIFGLSGSPYVGDIINVVKNERKAREVAVYRQSKFREIKFARQQKSKLKNIFVDIKDNYSQSVNIILKSDFQGSSEAVIEALHRLSTDQIKINIIYFSIGSITEDDANLAATTHSIILGFNVKIDCSARYVIESEKINVFSYLVIYDLVDGVKDFLSSLSKSENKYKVTGLAEVKNVFGSLKSGFFAGCLVIKGTLKRHNKIRILRDSILVHEGKLESLRRFKDDVNEVHSGIECGVGIKNYDVRSGDLIEVLDIVDM